LPRFDGHWKLRESLARINHKFSTAATPPSSERSEEIIRAGCTARATRKRVPPVLLSLVNPQPEYL